MAAVRRAQLSDIDSIVKLSVMWEEEGITFGLKANSPEKIETYLNRHCWIAALGDNIIGYLLGDVRTNNGFAIFSESEKYYFEIEEIYIHPEYRRSGVGTELIQEVTGNLKNQGILRMAVSTANKDWTKALEFYDKFGFKTWTITMFK